MDNSMVSKFLVGMSTTNIHLLQFKIQSHLQETWTLNAGTSYLIPKKNCQKIFTITFASLPFLHENTLTKLLP